MLRQRRNWKKHPTPEFDKYAITWGDCMRRRVQRLLPVTSQKAYGKKRRCWCVPSPTYERHGRLGRCRYLRRPRKRTVRRTEVVGAENWIKRQLLHVWLAGTDAARERRASSVSEVCARTTNEQNPPSWDTFRDKTTGGVCVRRLSLADCWNDIPHQHSLQRH